MFLVQGQDPFYVKAITEHRDVGRLVVTIETELTAALRGGKGEEAAWVELLRMLKDLRTHLQKHFAEEEEGGLLDEAVSRLPRLGPQATALEREHAPLLAELDSVLQHAERGGHPEKLAVARDFSHFTTALRRHEAAENRLAEEAFDTERRELLWSELVSC